MRVTRRTADELIVEESPGTEILIRSLFAGIGAVFALIGWTNGPTLFLFVGPLFAFIGLKYLICARTTHHFKRRRGMITIETKGRWGSVRRELPVNSIADVTFEEIRYSGHQLLYLLCGHPRRVHPLERGLRRLQ